MAAFTTIVQSVTADVAAINVTPAFADDAADTVVNALTDVRVSLISRLSDKSNAIS